MLPPNNIVHVAAVATREQRVALVCASDGWSLPVAPVPLSASPHRVAEQIAHERIGLPTAVDRLSGVFADDDGVLIAYMASCEQGEPPADVEFFARDALPSRIASSLQVAALTDWAASHLHGVQTTRYCPRCGSARLSPQEKYGRQRMTCATCSFVFFRDPKVGAGVFIEEDGRVLLIRRGINPGMDLWCLPSGFIEHDESPETAAMREAKEETGLDVRLGELMGLHSYLDPTRGNGILILYRARVIGGTLTPGDDAKEAHYFAPDELPPPGQIAFRTHRIVLQEWRTLRATR